MAKNRRNVKDKATMDDIEKEAKSIVERLLGDISKTSATKQIILGASSGWVTGFLAMRIGKTTAMALGGGIILLQIANEKGYIKINWDKLNRNVDKITDQVEETITRQSNTLMDKAEKYVDRKCIQVEDSLKRGQSKARKLLSRLTGDNNHIKEIHIFLLSFIAGVAIGIGTS